jgi:hypothetical protein
MELHGILKYNLFLSHKKKFNKKRMKLQASIVDKSLYVTQNIDEIVDLSLRLFSAWFMYRFKMIYIILAAINFATNLKKKNPLSA